MKNDWKKVKLGEVLTPVQRAEAPVAGMMYRQLGVRLWGEGAYERDPVDGAQTTYAYLFRAETDDVVVNKIWARNGSVALVQPALAGTYGSTEFPMFAPNRDRLVPRWMHWLTKTPDVWSQCDDLSKGTSGKNRIKPSQFLQAEIPLPPLSEQRRIVARIDKLAAHIQEARALRKQEEDEMRQMLLGAFRSIAKDAPRSRMGAVAPLVRRPVNVEAEVSYPELGIRSFGKGTFHKPTLSGLDLGSKRVFNIEPGDLLFSNVFAWEGAIAVAKVEDAGRIGSHRYMSCVADPERTTANFLCFYFLTREGLELIGAASPGGAGRNRTLGLEALSRIQVPVPTLRDQIWFDNLQTQVDVLKRLHAETAAELDALMPSILDRAFNGKL